MTPPPDYSNDPRAKALASVLGVWLASHPNWYLVPDERGWGWRQRSAKEVAVDLVPVLGQMDMRLAGVLQSPDGQLMRTVAGWVLLPQQAVLFELLSEAIILAAQAQNRGQKVEAGLLTGAALALLAGLLLTRGDEAAGLSTQAG